MQPQRRRVTVVADMASRAKLKGVSRSRSSCSLFGLDVLRLEAGGCAVCVGNVNIAAEDLRSYKLRRPDILK